MLVTMELEVVIIKIILDSSSLYHSHYQVSC